MANLMTPETAPTPTALRVFRAARGLTQRELAELANVSPRTVHRLEHGELGSLRTLRKLAAALAVPVEQLLGPGEE